MAVWADKAAEVQSLLDKGYTNAQLANHFGVSQKTIENQLPKLEREGHIQRPRDRVRVQQEAKGLFSNNRDVPPEAQIEIDKQGHEVKSNWKTGEHFSQRLVWMCTTDDKDEEFLLREHGYDAQVWEITSSTSKRWNGYSKQDGIFTLFSSTINVKKRIIQYTEDDMMKFLEKLSSTFVSPVHKPSRYSKQGKLLEVDIADLHVGKLAWSGDSGDTYNHEIARERFFYIINDVISKTSDYTFDRILFVWANDFFHIDGPSKTTTKGTPQDVSMQFEHMFEFGAEMLVEGMDLVNQVAPVTTMYMASNHDRLVSFFATKYLQAWYRNNKHVIVDSQPLARKVVRFGQNLTGYTHGHLEKKQMGAWMANEYRATWGETYFHEVHAHHIHSERSIIEENGQITRFISSPTGTDRWHHDGAYTGAIQKGQSFIYDRENGLENTMNSTIIIQGRPREAIVI